MSFYPLLYPAQMGQDNDISFFNVFCEESGESSRKECSDGEEIYSSLTVNITGNNGKTSISHPTFPYDETPAAETFESQSSSNSARHFDPSRSGEGASNETGNSGHHIGEHNESGLMSSTASPFCIPPFDIGVGVLNVTDYENVHNYAMTSTSLDFAEPTPSTFTQSTHDEASSTDKTGFWPSQPMIQASSWEFWQQEPHPADCPSLAVSPNTAARPMTSIATQTSEDPTIGNTPHQVYMPTTRTASRTSGLNVNPRASANFTCHIDGCTRSYTRKFELARHLKNHSGIKEHHCRFPTCIWAAPNGFVRKDHLKQHLRQVHKTLA